MKNLIYLKKFIKTHFIWILSLTIYFFLVAFTPFSNPSQKNNKPREKLSEYGLFAGEVARLQPAKGTIPYNLNTPLFSDYSHKLRFIKVPDGQQITYNDQETLEFPVGTILVKTFYYPIDFRDESKGRRLIETRLLIHKEKGWTALPYIWNQEQTDAYLDVAGTETEVNWKDKKGKKQKLQYVVPNMNQCKGCHNKNEQMMPIGPSVRQLNRDFSYMSGNQNQLHKWKEAGILTGLPGNLTDVPKLPEWDNPVTGSLEQRARAYLDINCAHCHRKAGPANTSGLFLDIHQNDPTILGVNKAPVAAGKGSGGREYGIVPGKPDESILIYRMASKDPGAMMPELGRKMIHKEGLALIREWIQKMP